MCVPCGSRFRRTDARRSHPPRPAPTVCALNFELTAVPAHPTPPRHPTPPPQVVYKEGWVYLNAVLDETLMGVVEECRGFTLWRGEQDYVLEDVVGQGPGAGGAVCVCRGGGSIPAQTNRAQCSKEESGGGPLE